MPGRQPVSNIPMTKEEVAYWFSEVEASEKFQEDQFINRVGYEELIRYYEGIQKSEFTTNLDQLSVINELYPACSSVIKSSYNSNPAVTVKPLHPLAEQPIKPPIEYLLQKFQEGVNPADINFPSLDALMKSALDYAIQRNDLKEVNQLALFDLLVAGFACVEVNHLTKRQEFVGQDVPRDTRNLAEKVSDGVMESLEGGVKKMLGIETGESTKDTEERISQSVLERGIEFEIDSTYIERWNPLDILFDYRAKTFSKSRYVVKKVRMTEAEFNNEFPAFKDTSPGRTKRKMEYSSHRDSKNNDTILVYEIQIKKASGCKILMLSPGIPEALAYYDLPFITNGFTIKYGSIDKYGTLYPMSRMKLAKKSQDDLNHFATIEMEHADRSPRKVAYYKEGLTAEGVNAIKSPDIYALIEKATPNAVFEMMPQAGQLPENEMLQRKHTESINKLLATTELAKSGSSDSKFATQDALKAQAFEVSSSEVQDAIGDLTRDELNTLKDIIQQFWDGEYFLKITGLQGGDFWYTPEMGKLADVLLGDYLVDVDITTAARRNPMTERQKTLEFIQFITSPMVQQYAAMNNKMVSFNCLEEAVRDFGKNPNVVFDDIDPNMKAMILLKDAKLPKPQGQGTENSQAETQPESNQTNNPGLAGGGIGMNGTQQTQSMVGGLV